MMNSLPLRILKKLFNRTRPALTRFACTYGGYYVSTPVTTARELLPQFVKEQVRKAREANNGTGKAVAKFIRCPGMYDLAQQGYLIYAQNDIHVMANKHNVLVDVPQAAMPELHAKPMDYEVVEGLAPIKDVKPVVFKVPCPWSVHTDPGYSAHVLPAFFHFPYFDKIYVYPGTVDYDDFHTINFIFSVITPCDFVIPAGTPILQVLPFKREPHHATSGRADQLERDRHMFGFPSRVKGAYRRLFLKKKTFTIEITK